MTARNKYPALMAYIEDRSANFEKASEWCSQLRKDEVAAEEGSLADVAQDLMAAQNDYKLMKKAECKDGFPYNSAMGMDISWAAFEVNPRASSRLLHGELRDEVLFAGQSKARGRQTACRRSVSPARSGARPSDEETDSFYYFSSPSNPH